MVNKLPEAAIVAIAPPGVFATSPSSKRTRLSGLEPSPSAAVQAKAGDMISQAEQAALNGKANSVTHKKERQQMHRRTDTQTRKDVSNVGGNTIVSRIIRA